MASPSRGPPSARGAGPLPFTGDCAVRLASALALVLSQLRFSNCLRKRTIWLSCLVGSVVGGGGSDGPGPVCPLLAVPAVTAGSRPCDGLRHVPPLCGRRPPPRALPAPFTGDGAGRRNPAVSSPKGLPVSAASGDGTRGPRGRRDFIKAPRVAGRRSTSAFSICRMSAATHRLVASRVFVRLRLSRMVPSLRV